jgi:hypothetical protein
MALVTRHTKGTVPVDSCPCPKVGAPRKGSTNNVVTGACGSVVGGPAFPVGKDFKPGSKGQLHTGRSGGHGKI